MVPSVRIVAATNRNLFEEMEQGRFRADLFFRLAVLMVRIPPLRERMEDLSPADLAANVNCCLCAQLGGIVSQAAVQEKAFAGLHHDITPQTCQVPDIWIV